MSFPHHTYQNDPAEGRFELIPASAVRTQGTLSQLASVPGQLRRAKVREILLIHGTFTGNDAWGVLREIARFSPKWGNIIKARTKQIVDSFVGETGNYSQDFADRLADLINAEQDEEIPVTPFHWSGENHHLGRAEAAVTLLDRLLSQRWTPGDRLLLWGHSHAGNVLALLSNLRGASRESRQAFFQATRSHYRDPIWGKSDLPQWERVRRSLDAHPTSADKFPAMDVVTFGTPLRYRWNTQICRHLLHFVHHRPLIKDSPAQALLPKVVEDVLRARGGDYIQQLGIAGTNFLPNMFAWRSWLAEHRLNRLLQPGIRRRDLMDNLKRGGRVSLDGTTLLVDYGLPDDELVTQLAGHAVYTRHQWLPFHLREITSRFYAETTTE